MVRCCTKLYHAPHYLTVIDIVSTVIIIKNIFIFLCSHHVQVYVINLVLLQWDVWTHLLECKIIDCLGLDSTRNFTIRLQLRLPTRPVHQGKKRHHMPRCHQHITFISVPCSLAGLDATRAAVDIVYLLNLKSYPFFSVFCCECLVYSRQSF